MAILKSEETQCPTSLELTFVRERSGADAVHAAALAAQTGAGAVMPLAGTAQVKGADDQTWAYVAFNLVSGGNRLTTPEGADFVLCRRPADEVAKLADLLDQFAAKKIERVLFEPSEPSFEISVERTARGGIKVEAWLDAGNATTAIYTWDAAGIRFYTTDEHVVSFTRELRSEFQIARHPERPTRKETEMESTLDLSKIELHAGLYAEQSGFHELRERLESEGFTVFVWQDSPGTSYQNLTKPTDELIVVSQGRIVITVGDMEYGLSAGDALTMPANTMHNAQNVDHMACCYFICTKGGDAPIMKRPE